MRHRAGLAAISCLVIAVAGVGRVAAAEVVISINKAAQTMSVQIDGAEAYNWVVSTGTGGGPHDGTYRPGRMERKWASRKYGMAPMPYSIFFDGNYAIHGTVKISQLGRRASKGCVRLRPRDAAVLFELVKREKENTTIVVDKTTHVAARVKPSAAAAEALAARPDAGKSETIKSETIKSETTALATGSTGAVPVAAEPAVPAKPRKARSGPRRKTSLRSAPRYRVYYFQPWF